MKSDQILTAEKWMQRKRDTEGAEGLWRIGDDLYDLRNWINNHPGGSDWIKITEGTDITEAFESHHISTKAEQQLARWYVRKANSERLYAYTFHKDGFYRTLKAKVRDKLANKSQGSLLKSIIIMDSLSLITISLCIISSIERSFFIGHIAGFFLSLSAICSHNFFHLRNNWRMYYFHLSLLSVKSWRITHVLSHHLHTNTKEDLEITLFEPFFQWLPKTDKHWIPRNLSAIYSPVIFILVILKEALQRLLTKNYSKEDIISLIIPCLMIAFGLMDFKSVFLLWIWIICSCSFYFVFIGIVAGHHHPDIYHEGDAHRKDQDWGLHQLDAVRDRIEIKGNSFISLITFGDHCLHHLFPTLDHSILPYLHPLLEETCADFGIQLQIMSTWDLVYGQFRQLARNRPNLNAPK